MTSQAFRKVIIGGNWKSNGDIAATKSLIKTIINPLNFDKNKAEVVIAPMNIHLALAQQLLAEANNGVELSAQNVSLYNPGAYTGEVSAKAYKDMNVNWAIIGHSERRQYFGETNEIVGAKTKICLDNNMNVMACIGEKLEEREANKTMDVLLAQLEAIYKNTQNLANVVVAYEPVWAIGTGKTASKEQAQEVHEKLREWIAKNNKDAAKNTRIIYGGSVTDSNANELIAQKDIDGFLVGGASLKPAFKVIVEAYKNKNL